MEKEFEQLTEKLKQLPKKEGKEEVTKKLYAVMKELETVQQSLRQEENLITELAEQYISENPFANSQDIYPIDG